MSDAIPFPPGGYRFAPGVFQYSGGVAAEPGYVIERVRFRRPVPLAAGFARIAAHLAARGRPTTAFCACELRSPAPFTEAGFEAFNRGYVGPLTEWGLYDDGVNPVARTNVCPAVDPPAEPSFHAFSYTVPADVPVGGFVVAGSGESSEGAATYREGTIRYGDRSAEGMTEKARWVLGKMEARLATLGQGWADVTGTHLYTVYDPYPHVEAELARRGAMAHGLEWHWVRPPVEGLDYEMDVRGVVREHVIEA